MNTFRLAMAFGVLVCCASGVFLACSGDDAAPSGSTEKDASSNNGDDSGGNNGDDDSGNTPPKDSGSADTGPKQTSDPGKIACGTATCMTFETCCQHQDAATPDNCADGGGGTCGPFVNKQRCDEKADCTGDQVCCGNLSHGPIEATWDGSFRGSANTCTGTCDIGNSTTTYRQICRLDSECSGGQKCITETCHGRTISTCGGISQDGGPKPSYCN